MAWRSIKNLLSLWYLILPALLIGSEIIAARGFPFSSPYFSLLIDKQPFLLLAYSALALSRAYLAYVILAAALEILTQFWLPFLFARAALFLFSYLIVSHYTFENFPGLLKCFPHFSLSLVLPLLLIVLSCMVWSHKNSVRTSYKKLFVLLPTLVLLLLLLKPMPWEGSLSDTRSSYESRPSFFVLSFDALPGEFFSHEEEGRSLTPLWDKHWKRSAVQFKNAYSVTNSTYTSWFSTLTGTMPLQSGVLSLYPASRTGSLPSSLWKPKELQKLGYNTVFMTDCANTSFMERDFGFDLLFQPDKGAFNSLRALVTSSHPALHFFSLLKIQDSFFPEFTSFSSHQYDPAEFFKKVQDIQAKLDRAAAPYALFIHSCTTHRDMIQHLPGVNSPLRVDLPNFHGFRSASLKEFFLTIRTADYFLDQTLQALDASRKPVWKFATSDHGIRMDKKGDQLTLFSHAIGDAVSRYQFNIPLAIIPPSNVSLVNHPESLVTVQDLGNFLLKLAESKEAKVVFPVRNHLVLTSAVPSDEPGDWGKTLVPLIKRGNLSREGTFRFSEQDETSLNEVRSRAILNLPYRAVWSSQRQWEIYNELKDPFNEFPLGLEDLKENSQFLLTLLRNPEQSLKVN